MTDPEVILDSMVAAFKTFSGLEAALGTDATIADDVQAFKDSRPDKDSLDEFLSGLRPPLVVIAWITTAQPPAGSGNFWIHTYGIYVHPGIGGNKTACIKAIAEGVSNPGLNWLAGGIAGLDKVCPERLTFSRFPANVPEPVRTDLLLGTVEMHDGDYT